MLTSMPIGVGWTSNEVAVYDRFGAPVPIDKTRIALLAVRARLGGPLSDQVDILEYLFPALGTPVQYLRYVPKATLRSRGATLTQGPILFTFDIAQRINLSTMPTKL